MATAVMSPGESARREPAGVAGASRRRAPAPRLMVAGIVVTSIVYALWTWFGLGGDRVVRTLDDVGLNIPCTLAAVGAGFAAWKHHGTARVGWAFMAAAAMSWNIGEAIWSWYELVSGETAPFPSVADIGYFTFYPLAFAGCLMVTGAPGRGASWMRSTIDGLIVAAALLALSWSLAIGAIYAGNAEVGLLGQTLALGYTFGDVVLVAVLLIVLSRARPHAVAYLAVLMLGIAPIAFSDTFFSYLGALGLIGNAVKTVDTGWWAGFLLIAFAGFLASRAPADDAVYDENLRSRLLVTLPYVPVLATAIVLIRTELVDRAIGPVVFWASLVSMGLIVVRQFTALSDNIHLVSALDQAHARLDFLLIRTVETAEDERTLLAMQLHDGPIQHLAAMALSVDVVLRRIDQDDTPTIQIAQRVRKGMGEEIHSLRHIMSDLRPPALDEAGLEGAIRDHAMAFTSMSGVTCDVLVEVDEHSVARAVQTLLYRITQEALVNVAKHAQASHVRIALSVADRVLHLVIEDDGVGMAPRPPDEGRLDRSFGLAAMQYRVRILGGSLEVRSQRGKGTAICVTVPVDVLPADVSGDGPRREWIASTPAAAIAARAARR